MHTLRYVKPSTANERKLLDDVAAMPKRAKSESYAHPAAGSLPNRGNGPLSPAEIEWIRHLPEDPAQVSFADAQVLASKARHVTRMNHPEDARLIEQVWRPVREIHDLAEAEVAERNANAPYPPIPSSALNALADAYGREVPGISPTDAITQARANLDAIAEQRARAKERALARVKQAKQAVAESERARTATTAVTNN